MSISDEHGEELRPDLVVHTKAAACDEPTGIEAEAINAIRFLVVDAVEAASSGHPGTPMGLAPLAYSLWTRHLRYDPAEPQWPDRDRFVLSGGHASLLQYAALHLTGYDLTTADLEQFRQWDSRTPGHPERERTAGIEINTGPLGQGVGNAVGMAIAERMLAARFNRPGHTVVDHRTWVTAGEGHVMEGITAEAASLASRLRLGKLVLFYDDNQITLEGPAKEEIREDVGAWFESYGWQVGEVGNVNDLPALDAAIEATRDDERPSLVIVHSHIGYGSPVQDTAAAHGKALGAENVAATREKLGWSAPPFVVPEAVQAHWRGAAEERAASHADWQERWARYQQDEPDLAAELERVTALRLPDGWEEAPTPSFDVGDAIATRKSAGRALNAWAAAVPELVGGSADVAPSTDTNIDDAGDINCNDWSGRNIHFGVREHAMGAICNGMAAHGGLRPYCATFFSFSDYMREPIRIASIMGLPVVFVFTHDSIALGEDGPTHQPVEQLASLRAMPGLRVIRPADANEATQAWKEAIGHDGPTALILTRQGVPTLDADVTDVSAGATVVAPGDDATIVATGSEVGLALEARDLLAADGVAARVVSMPSWELFRDQDRAAREQVIPPGVPSVSVEAGATQGWLEFVDRTVGIDHFGASAPGPIVMEKFGFTPDAVADAVRAAIDEG